MTVSLTTTLSIYFLHSKIPEYVIYTLHPHSVISPAHGILLLFHQTINVTLIKVNTTFHLALFSNYLTLLPVAFDVAHHGLVPEMLPSFLATLVILFQGFLSVSLVVPPLFFSIIF